MEIAIRNRVAYMPKSPSPVRGLGSFLKRNWMFPAARLELVIKDYCHIALTLINIRSFIIYLQRESILHRRVLYSFVTSVTKCLGIPEWLKRSMRYSVDFAFSLNYSAMQCFLDISSLTVEISHCWT